MTRGEAPADGPYAVLFEPVQVGPVTLRNRFYATPQCSGFGADRPHAQAYHRAMKAAGGFAVVHTEWCAIHPEADEWPAVTGRLWDEDDARNLGLMVEMVHAEGALAGVQLGFNGAHSENLETRRPARGITQVPSNTFHFHSCYEMTEAEIVELQGFYVEAALRAREVGFDVINVCANENAGIPLQFLMRAYNRRDDRYGGPFENRARFLLELLERLRGALGDSCALTVRLAVETHHDGDLGMRPEHEARRVIEMADDLVDLWDLEVTGRSMAEWGESAGPSRFHREGYQLAAVEKARSATAKPVVNVGRFVHPEAMVDAVRRGVIDLVGMARPGIADPFLPTKIRENRVDEIRECIGCNICISRYEQKATIICTQNATIGEEYRRGWNPERFEPAADADRDVLVIGAGPAGMECALVLARRGMRRVHLVDRERELGGHLRWVTQLPGLGEWARVVDYRKIALAKLRNATFVPGTELSAADVLEYGAELVVVANGSSWARDGLNGFDHAPIRGADASLPHVLVPEQVMVEGKPVPDGPVLVYDCEGYYMAASLAERLAREGREVTFVTPFAEVAPYMDYTLEAIGMNRLLRGLGVALVPQHRVAEVGVGAVHGHHVHDEAADVEWPVAATVLCTQRVSDAHLFRTLEADPEGLEQAGIEGLYRIGDCFVPRIAAESVFEGHRLGREIDSPDPSEPLGFPRERLLV
ncbi:MAG: FAD-dependent oxidoreductase [Actinobacteria bacterium]|nr:FAD-dependent oxidoreductase [Actinomycetota bacterium]